MLCPSASSQVLRVGRIAIDSKAVGVLAISSEALVTVECVFTRLCMRETESELNSRSRFAFLLTLAILMILTSTVQDGARYHRTGSSRSERTQTLSRNMGMMIHPLSIRCSGDAGKLSTVYSYRVLIYAGETPTRRIFCPFARDVPFVFLSVTC